MAKGHSNLKENQSLNNIVQDSPRKSAPVKRTQEKVTNTNTNTNTNSSQKTNTGDIPYMSSFDNEDFVNSLKDDDLFKDAKNSKGYDDDEQDPNKKHQDKDNSSKTKEKNSKTKNSHEEDEDEEDEDDLEEEQNKNKDEDDEEEPEDDDEDDYDDVDDIETQREKRYKKMVVMGNVDRRKQQDREAPQIVLSQAYKNELNDISNKLVNNMKKHNVSDEEIENLGKDMRFLLGINAPAVPDHKEFVEDILEGISGYDSTQIIKLLVKNWVDVQEIMEKKPSRRILEVQNLIRQDKKNKKSAKSQKEGSNLLSSDEDDDYLSRYSAPKSGKVTKANKIVNTPKQNSKSSRLDSMSMDDFDKELTRRMRALDY